MIVVLTAVIAAAAFAVPAFADSPHFIRASGTLNANGTLTASFKEAGLGANQNINYTLSANATATYVCVNKGGANPSAQNKTTVAGPVTASGTFNSGKNGEVTASLTVSPPPSDISCPPGQKLELASVSYSNATVTDTTNGVSIAVGDFSSGCLLPDVRGAC
jgi:type II secretory pathway pseudopilin PulG